MVTVFGCYSAFYHAPARFCLLKMCNCQQINVYKIYNISMHIIFYNLYFVLTRTRLVFTLVFTAHDCKLNVLRLCLSM